MKFGEKKKDESLSGTEVPRDESLGQIITEYHQDGFFYGTCMVFMMLQAVICVIILM